MRVLCRTLRRGVSWVPMSNTLRKSFTNERATEPVSVENDSLKRRCPDTDRVPHTRTMAASCASSQGRGPSTRESSSCTVAVKDTRRSPPAGPT